MAGSRPDSALELERALDAQGLRQTLPRRTILEVIAGMDRPFTSTELTEHVAKVDPRIGRASVYRLLQLLRSCGYVERLHGPATEAYILCLLREHHHHVTCSVCGRAETFTLEDAAPIERAVERVGYRMEHHVLEVVGICAPCRQQSEAKEEEHPCQRGAGTSTASPVSS